MGDSIDFVGGGEPIAYDGVGFDSVDEDGDGEEGLLFEECD